MIDKHSLTFCSKNDQGSEKQQQMPLHKKHGKNVPGTPAVDSKWGRDAGASIPQLLLGASVSMSDAFLARMSCQEPPSLEEKAGGSPEDRKGIPFLGCSLTDALGHCSSSLRRERREIKRQKPGHRNPLATAIGTKYTRLTQQCSFCHFVGM